MDRLTSILVPLSLSALGLAICTMVIHFTGRFSDMGSLVALAVGLPVAVAECILVKNTNVAFAKYLRLDGAIFPFLSLGIAAAIVIF